MRSVLAFVLALGACGDPLADGDYTGEAKLQMQAIISGASGEVEAAEPRFGLIWKWYDAGRAGWVVSEARSVPVSFPAVIDLEIYDPPPTPAPTFLVSDRGPIDGVDVGCPILFDDVDGDGQFGGDDRFLAVSWNELLVFDRAEETYRLFEGICSESGDPSGRMRETQPDHPLDLRFLEMAVVEQPCVRFF